MSEHEQMRTLEEHGYTRSQVRSLVFHLIYAMEENGYDVPLALVIDGINKGYDQHIPVDSEIAHAALEVVDRRRDLDIVIQEFLEHWRLERLGLCTRLILRLGTWELLATDTAISIIINEAVELAKDFAEKDSYKFINGILDKIAARRDELSSKFRG